MGDLRCDNNSMWSIDYNNSHCQRVGLDLGRRARDTNEGAREPGNMGEESKQRATTNDDKTYIQEAIRRLWTINE